MPRPHGASRLLLLAAAVAVASCGDGGDDDGGSAPGPNPAPVISGQPLQSVKADDSYAFTPTASDPANEPLQFSVSGLPAWATFNSATGTLSGRPGQADVSTYSDIVISVSDGTNTVALPPFSIIVTAFATGQVTLAWTPPLTNEDGTSLSLGGYRIYYGATPTALAPRVDTEPYITRYVVEGLTPQTWYFAITALNASGIESELSNVVSKTVAN